jgi:hypothetical protein
MEKTGGDLAGWLGDLAPRGDLDSTQLLYRLCGVDMVKVHQACHVMDDGIMARTTAGVLTNEGLPLLSLAFRMLRPVSSREGAHSCENSRHSSSNSSSSTTTTTTTDKHHQTARGSRSSSTPSGRGGPSFIEAWVQSPASLDCFASPCRALVEAATCVHQVRVSRLEQAVQS